MFLGGKGALGTNRLTKQSQFFTKSLNDPRFHIVKAGKNLHRIKIS